MPDMPAKRGRGPVWYNLSPLNIPLPGLVSILHRISGALLFLGLVWFLFLLDMSLGSDAGYARAQAYLAHPAVKLALLGFVWAFLHHFCAGVRYLFIDIDRGVRLGAARKTSVAVLAASVALTAIIGARLW